MQCVFTAESFSNVLRKHFKIFPKKQSPFQKIWIVFTNVLFYAVNAALVIYIGITMRRGKIDF